MSSIFREICSAFYRDTPKYRMRKKTRSILEELDQMVVERDRVHVLESRGQNIIDSAMNLIKMINENYDQEVAADLEKRLINSIRTKDPRKFIRGIQRIKK